MTKAQKTNHSPDVLLPVWLQIVLLFLIGLVVALGDHRLDPFSLAACARPEVAR